MFTAFTIVIDRRYISPPYQLPRWAESLPAKGPEIRIWATSTDMTGTAYERKTYYIILEDGGEITRFNLQKHTDGTLVAVPYAAPDYNYDEYDDWGYTGDDDGYCSECGSRYCECYDDHGVIYYE